MLIEANGFEESALVRWVILQIGWSFVTNNNMVYLGPSLTQGEQMPGCIQAVRTSGVRSGEKQRMIEAWLKVVPRFLSCSNRNQNNLLNTLCSRTANVLWCLCLLLKSWCHLALIFIRGLAAFDRKFRCLLLGSTLHSCTLRRQTNCVGRRGSCLLCTKL